jgi:hypothetical protein
LAFRQGGAVMPELRKLVPAYRLTMVGRRSLRELVPPYESREKTSS